MKRKSIILLLAVLYLVVGCSMFQVAGEKDSPELKRDKEYLAARKEFALTLQDYNDHYAVAPVLTQQKWKAEIDPVFKKVDKALDSWKLAIDKGFDPASQEQLYLKLKSELLFLLVDVFGVVKE